MKIFTGTTVEEAQQRAKEELKPRGQQQLVYKVVQAPRHGFFGIGRREAKVAAEIKEPVAEASQANNSAQAHPHVQTDQELDSQAEMRARHQVRMKHIEEASGKLLKYLKDVLKTLNIEAEPVVVNAQSHEILIEVKTDQPGRIIGRHGRRINALEQVSTAFMNYHGVPKMTVILDTSNYRQRRQAAIHQLAQRAVTEVVASGQAVFLDPMPARERKQLHQELEKNAHVKTYSHGREPYRSVVVAPRG